MEPIIRRAHDAGPSGIRSAIIGFDEELRANVLDRIGSFLGPATSWISKDMEPQ